MLDRGAREVGDEQLRLMLLCCHPALDRDTQVALTLRLLGGLTTTEIAAAFLLPEATLAQRIVRAKRKIRDARIPLSIPADLSTRVDAVLTVLYLVFNEGYLARGESQDAVRVSLVDEAVRLTIVARSLLPGDAEVVGPARARAVPPRPARHPARRRRRHRAARGSGPLALGRRADRAGERAAVAACSGARRPGPFQLQALIASQHANAPTAGRHRLDASSPTSTCACSRWRRRRSSR